MSSSNKNIFVQGKEEVNSKPNEPKFYQVIILNDDYTPIDFVIEILIKLFAKNREQAISLTYKIHFEGRCLVAIYPKEVAETKAYQVKMIAQKNDFPLDCITEPIR